MARFPGWRRFLRAAPGRVGEDLRQLAAETQGEMQAQAEWANRSGKAREALTARVETRAVTPAGRAYTIVLGYDDRVVLQNPRARGVNYGRYLEEANGGRYAIVTPTADRLRREVGPRALRAVQGA